MWPRWSPRLFVPPQQMFALSGHCLFCFVFFIHPQIEIPWFCPSQTESFRKNTPNLNHHKPPLRAPIRDRHYLFDFFYFLFFYNCHRCTLYDDFVGNWVYFSANINLSIIRIRRKTKEKGRKWTGLNLRWSLKRLGWKQGGGKRGIPVNIRKPAALTWPSAQHPSWEATPAWSV